MINSKTEHPNCVYLWMNYIISPQANAKVAEWFGEAPVESEGVRAHDGPDFCTAIHANDEAYWKDVYYWTTPTADCGGNGRDLQDPQDWMNAWTEIRG